MNKSRASQGIQWLGTALLFLLASALPGQDFSGTWIGQLTQELEPPFHEYSIRLELEQTDDLVTGTTYIYLPDSMSIFARMALRGVVKENRLYFRENQILSSYHFSDWDWCLKRGVLTWVEHEGLPCMAGVWQGFVGSIQCLPGKIAVARDTSFLLPEYQAPAPPALAEETPEKPIGPGPTPVPDELNGRKINRERTIEIQSQELVVQVWDANREDGDIISLYFNGDWLLRDYRLRSQKHPVRLQIVPGAENRLVLYAENLGRIPPNTCALTFNDGQQTYNFNLASDKETCGALRFVISE